MTRPHPRAGIRALAGVALSLLSLIVACATAPPPAPTSMAGCRPDLGDQAGARVTAQVLETDQGAAKATGSPSNRIQARSGQTLRLLIRPLDGPARPSGPECPVRVGLGQLTSIARVLNKPGLVFDRDSAYGLLRPDEERALDVQIKPFEEWDPALDRLEIEGLTIALPQAAEFIARLPAAFRPPLGTVCADVFYPDAQPAAGVGLNLSAPPDGPPNRRPAGDDGRVCWDGFDESLLGRLSLDPKVEPALGLPNSRYVSRETSYRLFVVKRSR